MKGSALILKLLFISNLFWKLSYTNLYESEKPLENICKSYYANILQKKMIFQISQTKPPYSIEPYRL